MNDPSTKISVKDFTGLALAFCLGFPFVLRLLLSWGFYGSTDTQNYLNAMEALLRGYDNLFNYYPPSFFPEALGAMGGLLGGLPMTAAFKMSHAIPDLILSGWFYTKLVAANGGQPSRRILLLTFLLQLAPSVVLVSHIHGQMDSWSILFAVMAVEFFLQARPAWAFVGGLCMIFGAGIKIFPLFLIPCFYLYRPWRIQHLVAFSLGLGAGFILYFSQRFSDPQLVWVIVTGALRYESQALMGIKVIIWPYLEKLPGGAPPLRLFVFGGLALAYLFVLWRRLDLYRSLLLVLLAVMTVSFHMAPQYLLWPTFLLFCTGLYRTAVVYNLGTGALLIFYYYYTRDNSGAYTPLSSLDALSPARPHWFDSPYSLHIFNDRLRGPGIWWVIAGSLVSLLVDTFRRRAEAKALSIDHAIFAHPRSLKTALAVLVTGYVVTLAFTWPSPFRRMLSEQLDADYFRQNYFSYGRNYLYEVTLPADAIGPNSTDAIAYAFSGNDFYMVFHGNGGVEGPFVGRAYPGHHGGVFGYKALVHTVDPHRPSARTPDGSIRFWILDSIGSIDDYRLPQFTLKDSAAMPVVSGRRVSAAQVNRLFSDWGGTGEPRAELVDSFGLERPVQPLTALETGALGPPVARLPERTGAFSIIEGLLISLGIWGVLGLLSSSWNLRASNT